MSVDIKHHVATWFDTPMNVMIPCSCIDTPRFSRFGALKLSCTTAVSIARDASDQDRAAVNSKQVNCVELLVVRVGWSAGDNMVDTVGERTCCLKSENSLSEAAIAEWGGGGK